MKIIQNIERNAAWDVVPEFYSDFVSLGLIWRERTVEEFLRLMKESTDVTSEEKVRMAACAWDMNQRLDSQYGIPNFVPYLQWKARWVMDVVLVLAKAGDMERSCVVVNKLHPNFQMDRQPEERMMDVSSGPPTEDQITEYFDFCMERKGTSFQQIYDILVVAEKYNMSCLRELACRYRNTYKALSEHETKLITEFINLGGAVEESDRTDNEGFMDDLNREEF